MMSLSARHTHTFVRNNGAGNAWLFFASILFLNGRLLQRLYLSIGLIRSGRQTDTQVNKQTLAESKYCRWSIVEHVPPCQDSLLFDKIYTVIYFIILSISLDVFDERQLIAWLHLVFTLSYRRIAEELYA